MSVTVVVVCVAVRRDGVCRVWMRGGGWWRDGGWCDIGACGAEMGGEWHGVGVRCVEVIAAGVGVSVTPGGVIFVCAVPRSAGCAVA